MSNIVKQYIGLATGYAAATWVVPGLLFVSLAQAQDQDVLTNARSAASYASGVELAREVLDSGRDLDFEAFILGLRDVRDGNKLALTDEQIKRIVRSVEGNQLRSNVIKRASSKKGLAHDGEVYLQNNAKAPGVVVTPSGLQYRVLKEGTGEKPSENSTVELRYTVKLVDGTKVDGSVDDNTGKFKIDTLMTGLKEALLLMPVGSVWDIVLPSPLAYGSRRVGRIGPDQILLLNVELVSLP